MNNWPFPTKLPQPYRDPIAPRYPSDAEEAPL